MVTKERKQVVTEASGDLGRGDLELVAWQAWPEGRHAAGQTDTQTQPSAVAREQSHTCTHSHTYTHTFSEQSVRILLWNASYMQKHCSYTYNKEWVSETTRESIKMVPSP